jgi:hypothetical protein
LGALLDDSTPMPDDIIGLRVLTPGGMLVLGGAPKVGKSDLVIRWLVHMAAGVPFLGFTPPRPLRVFYLQAEIQYHYLRERMQQIGLPTDVLSAARDNLVVTPKLQLLLDAGGSALVAQAIQQAFPAEPVDILCIDPIRNLFDGGPGGGGENDNASMMFFLKDRVEVLSDHVNPDCGIILIHHTKKLSKHQVKEDPFLALSGASALRGFYTSGLILHRPDEDSTQRRLEVELRNGPALPAKLIDKIGGRWVEINPMNERLVRAEVGAKHDAERVRKNSSSSACSTRRRGAASSTRLPSSPKPSRILGAWAGEPSSTTGSAFWPPRARSSSSEGPPPCASAWPRSGASTAISVSRECCSPRAAKPSTPTRARLRPS